eukprot:1160547-Pelagomonas_calceolata.AAC.3
MKLNSDPWRGANHQKPQCLPNKSFSYVCMPMQSTKKSFPHVPMPMLYTRQVLCAHSNAGPPERGGGADLRPRRQCRRGGCGDCDGLGQGAGNGG